MANKKDFTEDQNSKKKYQHKTSHYRIYLSNKNIEKKKYEKKKQAHFNLLVRLLPVSCDTYNVRVYFKLQDIINRCCDVEFSLFCTKERALWYVWKLK